MNVTPVFTAVTDLPRLIGRLEQMLETDRMITVIGWNKAVQAATKTTKEQVQ